MQDLQNCNLLLVDDEKEFIQTLGMRLELRGANVRIAFDGKVALELLKASLPDIILLDMCMPEMSGLATLQCIRKDYGNIPVFVITGYCSQTNYEAAMQLSVQSYHTKPIIFEDLAREIAAASR